MTEGCRRERTACAAARATTMGGIAVPLTRRCPSGDGLSNEGAETAHYSPFCATCIVRCVSSHVLSCCPSLQIVPLVISRSRRDNANETNIDIDTDCALTHIPTQLIRALHTTNHNNYINYINYSNQ